MIKDTFDTYYYKVGEQKEHVRRMDMRIEELAKREPYAGDVAKLRCSKGIDYLTALSILCRAGIIAIRVLRASD